MNEKSIYNIINDALTSDGRLPNNFALKINTPAPNELRFAPGAAHNLFGGNGAQANKGAKKMVKLLQRDWKKGSSSDAQLLALLKKYDTLSVADPVLDLIRKDYKNNDLQIIVDYASRLAFETRNEELVKLGIILLGLIDLSTFEEITDKLLTLALYEEFTLFSAVALGNCASGNDTLFALAQKIDGWGKINVVERLAPETEEIRDWLLRKGCENCIMDAYLGLECAVKGDLITALRRNTLDEALFDGISTIIGALLDEGPADGISAYEHAEEALQRYLQFAQTKATTLKHLWQIVNVQMAIENRADIACKELRALCKDITEKPTWQALIFETLENPENEELFFAVNVSNRLHLDITDVMFRAIKQHPIKHAAYLSIVCKNPDYARQLFEIYETTLPLDEMATGMGDHLFAETLRQEHLCLDWLLAELGKYPHSGIKLIQTALKSPVTRERIFACKALKEWVDLLGQPLKTLSPELFTLLSDTVSIEVYPNTKAAMKELLRS